MRTNSNTSVFYTQTRLQECKAHTLQEKHKPYSNIHVYWSHTWRSSRTGSCVNALETRITATPTARLTSWTTRSYLHYTHSIRRYRSGVLISPSQKNIFSKSCNTLICRLVWKPCASILCWIYSELCNNILTFPVNINCPLRTLMTLQIVHYVVNREWTANFRCKLIKRPFLMFTSETSTGDKHLQLIDELQLL